MTSSRFSEWQAAIFREAPRSPATALDILQSSPPDLSPGERSRAQFWKACLLCQVNCPGEALDALQHIDAIGHWISPILLQDPDLDPIRGESAFIVLAEKWKDRFLEESKRHSASLQIIGTAMPERRTLVALHMNNNDPRQTDRLFAPLVEQGWKVAIAGSGQYAGEGLAVWNDAAQADREVQQWAAQVGGPAVWAGLSRGGTTVLRNALTGAVEASGVLAVVPSVAGAPDWLPSQPLRIPLAFVVGEQDRLAPGVQEFVEELRKRGLPVKVWRHAGGHEVPEDWTWVRDEALAWLESFPAGASKESSIP